MGIFVDALSEIYRAHDLSRFGRDLIAMKVKYLDYPKKRVGPTTPLINRSPRFSIVGTFCSSSSFDRPPYLVHGNSERASSLFLLTMVGDEEASEKKRSCREGSPIEPLELIAVTPVPPSR